MYVLLIVINGKCLFEYQRLFRKVDITFSIRYNNLYYNLKGTGFLRFCLGFKLALFRTFNMTRKQVTVMYSCRFKVLEKCTKNLIGYSRLALNNHESNIDC